MAKRPKKEYIASKGAQFTAAQAAKYGPCLEAIRDRIGDHRIKPDDVIDEARSPDNPMHGYFQWDDEKAANNYRLQQARHLLNHLRVRVIIKGRPVTERAFVSVRYEPLDRDEDDAELQQAYVHYDDMGDAERRRIIEQAYKELEDWCDRYAHYDELASVRSAIQGRTAEDRAA